MSDTTKLEELIIRYLTGETTDEEARELRAWITLSAENQAAYESYKKIVDASGPPARNVSSIDVDKEWQHFLSEVGTTEAPVVPFHKSASPWMKIAAAVIAVALSGFIIIWVLQKNKEIIYRTGSETLAVVLPDGTRVTLNDHSSLSVGSGFGDRRRNVSLTGEAFFDVVHDASKPFLIQLDHSTVEVIGTSFDIRAYRNEKSVEVSVQTGIVKFSATTAKTGLRLTAGQNAAYINETSMLETVKTVDPNFSSWNTQRLVFVDNDLKSVIETLNRTYHTQLSLSTDAPPTCRITASFDHQSLEAVLLVLQTTLDLTIEHSGDKTAITHVGC